MLPRPACATGARAKTARSSAFAYCLTSFRIRLSLTEYLPLHCREMEVSPRTDKRDAWTRMLGLVDLAAKLVRAGQMACFGRMVPHLKLLGERDADPSQNAATGREDQSNHKLFELLVAASASTFVDGLEISSRACARPPSSMVGSPAARQPASILLTNKEVVSTRLSTEAPTI